MRTLPRGLSLLFTLIMLLVSVASFAQVGISITIAPPALPVYEQPLCPGEGYLWAPGYWAYDYDYGDYYWVPGTWVLAPEVGLLWTPPYWGWGGNAFIFHAGYWGPQVGFYGGIVYGFGYFGHGYEGGRWNNGQFFYNRAVNNINVTNIHNVYNVTVVNNTTVNRVSYNGGNGGINAIPTAAEEAAARERHVPPVAAQNQHAQAASANQQLRASVNRGKPPVAATAKPGSLSDAGVVGAKAAGAPYHPEPNAREPAPRPANASAALPENNVPRPPTPTHAKDLPPHQPPAPPSNPNSEAAAQYQQQQQKLYTQQQEHQQLQQSQEQDHQRLAQQKASGAQMQQMEQMHQQQTQQMEQRHSQQQQARQAPPAHN